MAEQNPVFEPNGDTRDIINQLRKDLVAYVKINTEVLKVNNRIFRWLKWIMGPVIFMGLLGIFFTVYILSQPISERDLILKERQDIAHARTAFVVLKHSQDSIARVQDSVQKKLNARHP